MQAAWHSCERLSRVTTTAVLAGGIDVEPLEDVLQAAFWDDPLMAWLLPDEASRSRRAARLFRGLLRNWFVPMRTTWTTADQQGAAMWAPPGYWRIPILAQLPSLPSMLGSLGGRALKAGQLMALIERHHPREHHWYLAVLGTNPPAQGKGIGSALMEPVLARCDEEGLPAYLESSKESNIPFYGRHGFEVTGELSVPGGPVIYAMRREPRVS
jgi:GNAT superfamily N-acetyltransferase